jgi:septum formation protein
MKQTFILASQSPRRKSLLQQLGYDFQCLPANIDETILTNESPKSYVERLARAKAQHIAEQYPEQVIVGSDTSVIFEGHILGKPESLNECIAMLSMLSGNTHQVLTAIAVIQNSRIESRTISTDVLFKTLSKQEIVNYWQTGEPQDKAGSYGIQGIAGQFVKQIHGSYSAVVGLPLYETAELLSSFGVYSTLASN